MVEGGFPSGKFQERVGLRRPKRLRSQRNPGDPERGSALIIDEQQ